MNSKIIISKLSNKEVLELIYTEYMRIKPKNNKEFYEKNCLPCAAALIKRFNKKYTDILIEAGIPDELLNIPKTDEYYLNILKTIADKLGHTPTIKELKEEGYDQTAYIYRFGTYNKAIELAGLKPNPKFVKKNINKNQILNDYKRLSAELGKPAGQKDIANSNLSYSFRVMIIKFGSFNNLREAAGYKRDNRGANNKKYSKELVLRMLVEDYIANKGAISISKINKDKRYPHISTIQALFNTTKMQEVWNEVAIEAINFLNATKPYKTENERIINAGIKGETNVAHNLCFLDNSKYTVYNDINIHSEKLGMTQQIDHIVVGPNGVFCIETKHYFGSIIINRNSKWEKVTKSSSEAVDNPTQQVIRHENILKSILPPIGINSIIVMGNSNTKVKNKELCSYPVINVNNILEYIQDKNAEILLTEKELRRINNIIKKCIVLNLRNVCC